MIAHSAEEPLQRITLNIFRKDYLKMKQIYGDGYSTKIRSIVRKHLKEWQERALEVGR